MGHETTIDHLWAPWRLAYIQQSKKPADVTGSGCFLCDYAADVDDATNLVVARTKLSICVLNRYPYNNGHLLIAPLAHKGDVIDLSDEETADGMRQLQRFVGLYRQVMSPEGFNIGLNLGRVAGAGLPGHLHWHLVPRWSGDTNFMPVVGATHVISQSLQALYELLVGAIHSHPADAGERTRANE